MGSEDLKRVNIRVTPEVYDWFMNKSKRTGVSMSALMYLALETHVQQQLSIPFISTSAIGREVHSPNDSTEVPRIFCQDERDRK